MRNFFVQKIKSVLYVKSSLVSLKFFEDLQMKKYCIQSFPYLILFNNSENLFSKSLQKSYRNFDPEYEYRKPTGTLKFAAKAGYDIYTTV
jgi:hypothetical protein